MDTELIRSAARQQPFKPFALRMNDGSEFYVPHPENVAVSHRVVYVIDPDTDVGISLEPNLIASMQENVSSPNTEK